MPAPEALLARHTEVVSQLKTHLADLDEGRTEDNAEARAAYDAINEDLTGIERRMQEHRRADRADEERARSVEASEALAERMTADERAAEKAAAEKAEAGPSDDDLFRALIRGEGTEKGKAVEIPFRRDLTVGTTTAGGDAVSTGFVNNLYEIMEDHAAIRQTRATVLRTATGNAIKLPRVTSTSTASKVAEGGTIGESDPAISQMTLNAYGYKFLTQVSSELEEDDEVAFISDFLGRQAGRALGDKTGEQAIIGDGTDDPNGVATAVTTGVTAASATAVTADELIDLEHSVIAPYRRNAEWLMSDGVLKLIRKLKDGDGNYLLNTFRGGNGPTLLDHPYVIDQNVPAPTTGLDAMLFGDFSTYFLRDAGGVRVERSEHFAFDTDLITYRFIVRFDSDLIDTTGSIKALTMG